MPILRPTITTSATPDYSAGDSIGGSIALANAGFSGCQVKIQSVNLSDNAGQGPALTLLFFRAAPSGGTYTDNAALAWGTGDAAKLVGVVKILSTDWYTVGSKSFVSVSGIGLDVAPSAAALTLLIAADGVYNAGSTSDLTLTIGCDQLAG